MQIQRCNSINCSPRSNSTQSVNFKATITQNPGQFFSRINPDEFYKALGKADKILGKIEAVFSQNSDGIVLASKEAPERASRSTPWQNIQCNVKGKFEEALVRMASDIVKQLS